MPADGPPTSPRLAALQDEVAADHDAALAVFWAEIAAAGAPLIEPLPDDPAAALVTFLWRVTAPVRNVVVVGGVAGLDFAAHQLAPLPGTDVLFKTYVLPRDTRTVYRLAPDDPLTPGSAVVDWAARMAGWQADPLNPRTFHYPADEADPATPAQVRSVLELPDAPPQPWVAPQAGVPAGTLHTEPWRSARLGNERRVWVYTPPGYRAAGAPYGLVLLFDGWAYIHLIPTPTILDNLLAAGRLPPLVAVLVDSPDQETRDRELECDPAFTAAVAEELIPWVRATYHVTADPAQTIVGGSSYGGLAAAFAGLRYPGLFGNVLAQSGGFWAQPPGAAAPEWLARQFATGPRLPLRFYLDIGRFERTVVPGSGVSFLAASRHLRDVLEARGYPLVYAEHNGGHDYLCWRGTLATGLLALVAPAGR